ncbi:MAG TPA: hypothetical protein VFZ61_32125, partial [Polyangiales bacterium]
MTVPITEPAAYHARRARPGRDPLRAGAPPRAIGFGFAFAFPFGFASAVASGGSGAAVAASSATTRS